MSSSTDYTETSISDMQQEQEQNIDQDKGKGDDIPDISACILFMLALLVINELVLKKQGNLKRNFPILAFIQPTSVTVLIGVFAGIILNITQIFNITALIQSGFSSIFLIIFLPPILYESAINMEKKPFYKNFGSIIMLAVFGTIIAVVSTAMLVYSIGYLGIANKLSFLNSLIFGSLISATDPVAVLSIFKQLRVDRNLFALIFGESILNDAVSIILFDTFSDIQASEQSHGIFMVCGRFLAVFCGSMGIGLLIGMISAWFLKNNQLTRNTSISENRDAMENFETTVLTLIPWVSYLIAEVFTMSGIVSIMFCGLTMARYALPNVTENSRKTNKRLYHTLAYTCENLVFILIGIGFVSFDLAWKEMGFSLFILSFIIIMLSRFLNIKIISLVLNHYRQNNLINTKFSNMMVFSGFRGAMAFALAMKAAKQDQQAGTIMLTITLFYAIISCLVFATALEPIILKLKLQRPKHELPEPESQSNMDQAPKQFWNGVKDTVALLDSNFLQKLLMLEGADVSDDVSILQDVENEEHDEIEQQKNVKRRNSIDLDVINQIDSQSSNQQSIQNSPKNEDGSGRNQSQRLEKKKGNQDSQDNMVQSQVHTGVDTSSPSQMVQKQKKGGSEIKLQHEELQDDDHQDQDQDLDQDSGKTKLHSSKVQSQD